MHSHVQPLARRIWHFCCTSLRRPWVTGQSTAQPMMGPWICGSRLPGVWNIENPQPCKTRTWWWNRNYPMDPALHCEEVWLGYDDWGRWFVLSRRKHYYLDPRDQFWRVGARSLRPTWGYLAIGRPGSGSGNVLEPQDWRLTKNSSVFDSRDPWFNVLGIT